MRTRRRLVLGSGVGGFSARNRSSHLLQGIAILTATHTRYQAPTFLGRQPFEPPTAGGITDLDRCPDHWILGVESEHWRNRSA